MSGLSEYGRTRLMDGARSLGVDLAERDIDRLAELLSLLQTWNRKINLTAVDDELGIIDRHLLDSLAVVPHVGGASTLVDVGSGPGFPGLVIATMCPALRVTSVESIHKKTAFQLAVRQALGLSSVEVLPVRDDAVVRAGRTFEVAVSRATFEPSEWLRHAVPLVGPGGLVIAMLTGDAAPLESPPELELLPRVSYEIGGVQRALQLARRAVPRGTDPKSAPLPK